MKMDTAIQRRIEEMRLIIATPFYRREAYVPYIASLVSSIRALELFHVNWAFTDVCGDAYVDRARNAIVADFLASKEQLTDLIFIDSDLGWNVEGFLRLLLTEKDFVGGVYPIKKIGDMAVQAVDPFTMDNAGLVQCEWIPGGFLHLKRNVLDAMVRRYEHDYYIDPRASYTGRTVNLFGCAVFEGQRYSEDCEFCRKWRAMGGKIWAEPRIEFDHVGSHVWSGCYQTLVIDKMNPMDRSFALSQALSGEDRKKLDDELRRIAASELIAA